MLICVLFLAILNPPQFFFENAVYLKLLRFLRLYSAFTACFYLEDGCLKRFSNQFKSRPCPERRMP
jgi:hypothetical protein